MKGIILAGGTGSRLYPLTKVTNKHLLPVYDKPMIYYPLLTLARAGIKDILIVSGPNHAGHFLNLLGSGSEFGLRLSYEIQDKESGIAHALALTEGFADEEKIVVILGDNIFEDDISEYIEDFKKQKDGAKVFLKEVKDPQRFGVAEIKNDKIVAIEEKPTNPKTNLAVAGLYMYDSMVFSIIKKQKPSTASGEFEITDVNNIYVKEGMMTYGVLKGNWTDAGTFESLFRANTLAREREKENHKKL